MSRSVEVSALRPGDRFEMAGGSIYVAVGRSDEAYLLQARLWCAHAPDVPTFEAPCIDLPPGTAVRLLSAHETRDHYRHEGYVQHVFAREMDRRHTTNMLLVNGQRQREAAQQHGHELARRPWWSKAFTRLGHLPHAPSASAYRRLSGPPVFPGFSHGVDRYQSSTTVRSSSSSALRRITHGPTSVVTSVGGDQSPSEELYAEQQSQHEE